MKTKVADKWDMFDKMFIRKNYPVMTLVELLNAINEIRPTSQQVGLSGLRFQCKRMGLSKGIQIRWSKKDITFLLSNYQKIGNVELAKILSKNNRSFRVIEGRRIYRQFTKKHVEKKMKLLGLHRTSEQILKIKKRNLITTNFRVQTSECNFWTQGIRKAHEEETVLIRDGKRFVKINGKFIPYTRWFYHNFIQPIPDGWIVYHLDCDVLNDDPDNLACKQRSATWSLSRYRNALVLLEDREKKIMKKLPRMNYDKQRDEIRRMHADLNRIRNIQTKINKKLNISWQKEEVKI